VQVRSRFAAAVQAAIDAYAANRHMLDAALAYAAHGIPVFPLSARSKAPIPKRDKDARGMEIPHPEASTRQRAILSSFINGGIVRRT